MLEPDILIALQELIAEPFGLSEVRPDGVAGKDYLQYANIYLVFDPDPARVKLPTLDQRKVARIVDRVRSVRKLGDDAAKQQQILLARVQPLVERFGTELAPFAYAELLAGDRVLLFDDVEDLATYSALLGIGKIVPGEIVPGEIVPGEIVPSEFAVESPVEAVL